MTALIATDDPGWIVSSTAPPAASYYHYYHEYNCYYSCYHHHYDDDSAAATAGATYDCRCPKPASFEGFCLSCIESLASLSPKL